MRIVSKIAQAIKGHRDGLSDAIRYLENQVLLFPVLVVLFANIAFLFGSCCSVWQWWLACVIVCVLPFLHKGKSCSAGLSCLMFLGIMLSLGLVTIFSWDCFSSDECACHLPAIHMLANGWNPIRDSTPEAVGRFFSFDPWDMRCLHLLFYQKSAWVLDAIGYLIYGDPLSVMATGVYYMFVGFCIVVVRRIKVKSWFLRFLLLVLLFMFSYRGNDMDLIVGTAGLGLMYALTDCLNRKVFCAVPLWTFTFWLIVVKPSGIIAAGIFWSVYAIVRFASKLRTSELNCSNYFGMGFVLLLVMAILVTNVSPYITSYKNYGHPLYPHRTSDVKKFPAKNLIGDFYLVNDDCKLMSPLALFVNAYISPSIVKSYYNWKHEREDFKPKCMVWEREARRDDKSCDGSFPLSDKRRIFLGITILTLLIVPKTRIIGVMSFLSLAAMPPLCYGYMRYFAWINSGLLVFAFIAISEALCLRFKRAHFLFCSIASALVFPQAIKVPMYLSVRVDNKLSYCLLSPKVIYTNRYSSNERAWIQAYGESLVCISAEDPSHSQINYLKFLKKKLSNLSKAEIKPLDLADVDKYKRTDMSFYVDQDLDVPGLEINGKRGDGLGRYLFYPKYVARMCGFKLFELCMLLHTSKIW